MKYSKEFIEETMAKHGSEGGFFVTKEFSNLYQSNLFKHTRRINTPKKPEFALIHAAFTFEAANMALHDTAIELCDLEVIKGMKQFNDMGR